jgi:hypothetical protein
VRGAAAPHGRWFPIAGTELVHGSGTVDDPLVARRTMTAGPDLEVVEELQAVAGEPHFLARWTVRNSGSAPVNFRATALANFGESIDSLTSDGTSLGIAELGAQRRLGSEVPASGRPAAPGEARGRGGLMEELPGSSWSQAELGEAGEMLARVRADEPMRDRYASGGLDAAAVAQWDRHALGNPALAVGQSTSFEVRIRLLDALRYEWTAPAGPDCHAGVRFSTAFGRGGPRADLRIMFLHGRGVLDTLRTDAAGGATALLPDVGATPLVDGGSHWPNSQWGGWEAWLDDDGDGIHDQGELVRYSGCFMDNQRPERCPQAAADRPPAAPALRPARPALRLLTAVRRGRRVIVRGRIARAARGHIRVTWRGRRGSRNTRRAALASPRAGQIARTLVLSRRGASARRQRVVLRYAGTKAFARASVTRNVRRARR